MKNAAATGGKTGIFFEPAKDMLQESIKNLFARSITYNNTELRRMFSDILGCNNAHIIDLVSFIFNKYDLFDVTFSDNINRQLIQIAQDDLTGFINNANSKFLAFYLSSLPKISFVPKEHIEQLTKMIICGIDSQKQTSKILDAMQIHPSADILLIFLLSQREGFGGIGRHCKWYPVSAVVHRLLTAGAEEQRQDGREYHAFLNLHIYYWLSPSSQPGFCVRTYSVRVR